ncbi:ATP-binding protein IstB [Rhodococcus sp. NCIMB 12038]|nr:ATP-binding protein IstB [Rhodococcus sp. NCIMB 12038]
MPPRKPSTPQTGVNGQLAGNFRENEPMPLPVEWLSMTTDALLAQSAIDRLTSSAHTLVIEGPSYRQRTRPGHDAVDSSEGEVDAR